MTKIDESLRPKRGMFFKKGMKTEEYFAALKNYRNAKCNFHKSVNKNKEWEKDMRNRKISRIYRKMKDSKYRDIQNKKKPIKKLSEF